jgi:hypothetical protein
VIVLNCELIGILYGILSRTYLKLSFRSKKICKLFVNAKKLNAQRMVNNDVIYIG